MLGISARHLQSMKKRTVSELSAIHLTRDDVPHISRPMHTNSPTGKITLRRQVDVLLDTFVETELTII